MRFLDKSIAVCLVPHPDDTAISMSNLVKKFSDTKFHMVYMSLGTDTDETSGMRRIEEESLFWKLYGVTNIEMHDVHDCNFNTTSMSKWVTFFDKLISKLKKVDVVFAPTNHDSHYEHGLANQLLYPITRFSPTTLLEYKTASSLHTWTPNFFVELSTSELHTKIECLRTAFESQVDSSYFSAESLVSFHSDFLNKKRNYLFSEMFNLKQFYW